MRPSPPTLQGNAIAFVAAMIFAMMATVVEAAPPPGWTAVNVGSPALAGTVNYTAGTGQTSVTGPGHEIDGTADRFQFIYQPLVGDGEISARVFSLTNAPSYPHAGLMLRASLAANSAHAEIFAKGDNHVNFRSRNTTGASMDNRNSMSVAAPVWLKLSRLGQRVTAYTSLDGIVWNDLGAMAAMPIGTTVYVGLTVSSTTHLGGGTSTFDNLTVRQAGPAPAGTTTTLVGPISTAAGNASTIPGQPGAMVLTSNGRDLGGSTPSYLFLHMPFSGDGEIRARIAGMSMLGEWSGVGLMVRDSLAPDALSASLVLSTTGLRRAHIAEPGANPTRVSAPGAAVLWLKLARHGAVFSTFSSPDGVSWSAVGKPFAMGMQSNILVGFTLSSGANDYDSLVQATVDQIAWPQAAPTPPALDPVIAAGLAAWRKPDPNGLSCVDCHTPFGYDIAQFNFSRADVRLATTPHLQPADADAIFDMLAKLRVQYPPVGGLKDFRTFRPMQPGGGQIVGGENASPDERDAAFGFYLKDHFRIGKDRIVTLPEASAAAQELIDVDTKQIPVGIKFNLWSRSVLREGAVTGGEVAEWLPSVAIQPKPEFAAQWFALQDAYLRDPSNENFWAIYHATSYWTRLDPHNFVPGTTHGNWEYVVRNQFLANLLFAHDTLLKSRGLPSQLDAEDGVRPFPAQRGISSAELAPFWVVGDNARVVQGAGFEGMPRRNRESVHMDLSYNRNLAENGGWQIQDLRLTWFWLGWMMDNSLRFSGEGSTLSGEYFIGSLWSGDVDNHRTGDSDSTHGYRMHQVFFNAVQHLKLGFKPGAWRDNDGPQHFEASKGYYLGYDRWRPRNEANEIGLPGGNSLYKRLLSNHLRMAMLIHADEVRKRGGVYFGEQYTLADLALWRDALNWADPEWKQADEALLAELKASISPPLTAVEFGDPDGDGQISIVESALGTAPNLGNPASAGSRVERMANGRLAITFNRVRGDCSYVIEGASDLEQWSVISTNPGAVGASVTVQDPIATHPPSRFLRLRIINAIP